MTDELQTRIKRPTDNIEKTEMTNSDKTLAEKIRETLVIDEPDEPEIVDALAGAVRIADDSWRIRIDEGIEDREPKDRVFTYLLAKYAAYRVSERDAPIHATRRELERYFDESVVDEVAEHGWVLAQGDTLQIRGQFLKPTADELVARYADE